MMEPLSPRAASVLLARALGHIELVQPATIREPIRLLLTGGIEMCATKRSLIGHPIESTLEIARALLAAVDLAAKGGAQPASRPQWTATPDPGIGG